VAEKWLPFFKPKSALPKGLSVETQLSVSSGLKAESIGDTKSTTFLLPSVKTNSAPTPHPITFGFMGGLDTTASARNSANSASSSLCS